MRTGRLLLGCLMLILTSLCSGCGKTEGVDVIISLCTLRCVKGCVVFTDGHGMVQLWKTSADGVPRPMTCVSPMEGR